MKPNGSKRKMDQIDNDVIPGTPQDKQLKKKQRKKSTKCVDCDDLLLGIDFTEDLVVKEPVVNNEAHKHNFDDLLHGIDFFDDFDCENAQVSRSLWYFVITYMHAYY